MNSNMTRVRWFSNLYSCALDESSLCIGRINHEVEQSDLPVLEYSGLSCDIWHENCQLTFLELSNLIYFEEKLLIQKSEESI